MLIDTHCHLTDGRFKEDVAQMIAQARKNGVEKIIVPATDLKDSYRVVKLIAKQENVYGLLGIYPGNAEKIFNLEDTIFKLKGLIANNQKIVGIGEIGLDSYWNERDLEKQKDVFRAQLELALELDKSVAVHSRGAEVEIREVFESMEKLPKGQFHCFGESEEFLRYLLEKGFYVSFCGNVTYKSADNLRGLAKIVPESRLLLETDAPYLPPAGKRGERNTPANVRITAEFLANLRGVRLEELERQTTKNAHELYQL